MRPVRISFTLQGHATVPQWVVMSRVHGAYGMNFGLGLHGLAGQILEVVKRG